MPQRNARPITFVPGGLSDAVDGSVAPAGAMALLQNLIPDPYTNHVMVPRPAATSLTSFAGFTTPGFVSGRLIVGDIEYGMIASGRNASKDEPYAYNLATNTFLTVSGITNASTPTSPATSGAWTPPVLAQVGSRIVVTHPGFAGGTVKFGWFDIGGLSTTITATTANGSPNVLVPSALGIQPGILIGDTPHNVLPANTTVIGAVNLFIIQNCTIGFVYTSGPTFFGSVTFPGGTVPPNIQLNFGVAGSGIPAGAVVSQVNPGNIVISNTVSAFTPGTLPLTFGVNTLVVSANAIALTTNANLNLTGGTTTAPQWGAGDCSLNPLPSVPVGVVQMNGRAYFALGLNGIVFSDSLFPCQVSNNPNVQALTTNDGLAVTAIAPLMLSSPLITSGTVQSLIVFQGTSKMQQITGDQVFNNLSMNALTAATGIMGALAWAACELGTAFVSPEGLRVVQFNGTVSDPIGDAGTGAAVPFIYSSVPSRIAMAANSHTIRITTQNGAASGTPQQEYWFDLGRKAWYGPMTSVASLIQPWRSTFVLTAVHGTAGASDNALYQSDAVPASGSVYTEFGSVLIWTFTTLAMPATGAVMMNALVDMTIMAQLANGSTYAVDAYDVSGALLDITSVTGTASIAATYQQIPVHYTKPIVFSQLIFIIGGFAGANLRIGNLKMRYQILGYPANPP